MDCPDRSVSPNCHTTCEGYLARCKETKERNEAKRKQESVDAYIFERNTKIQKYYRKKDKR